MTCWPADKASVASPVATGPANGAAVSAGSESRLDLDAREWSGPEDDASAPSPSASGSATVAAVESVGDADASGAPEDEAEAGAADRAVAGLADICAPLAGVGLDCVTGAGVAVAAPTIAAAAGPGP